MLVVGGPSLLRKDTSEKLKLLRVESKMLTITNDTKFWCLHTGVGK